MGRRTHRKAGEDHLDTLVLNALITRLRAQKNTQALGNYVDEIRCTLRRVARMTALWPARDRGELFTDIIARITVPRPGAKPPSHLVEWRRQWNLATGSVKSVQATVNRPGIPYRELRQIWHHMLGQRRPLPKSVLERVWQGGEPRIIAWRLFCETPDIRALTARKQPIDLDNLRRSLKRVQVPAPW